MVPPMASQTADLSGKVTPKTLAHYARLAQSGAALVMLEYSYIHWSGKSEANQLGIDSNTCIEGLSQVAAMLHQAGVVVGIQITHCGGKDSGGVSTDLMGPSGIAVPVLNRQLPCPRAMNLNDIASWQADFVAAAIRADRVGFDIVELHCAHGYGLNQFLSPITNHRRDGYGGSLPNRVHILVETIAAIKQRCPHLTLMVRVPGQDGFTGGLSCEDMIAISQLLVAAGVSVLNVSSGIGGWHLATERATEGYLVAEAQRFKLAQLGVPIVGVGGINSGDYIDKALQAQWFDLAAVGRGILENPIAFRRQTFPHANGLIE